MDGQIEDHTIAVTDWQPVLVADHGYEHLGYSPAPPVRATDRLMPLSIRQFDDDRQVVDFGQNINGRVRLRDLGPLGTSTVLVHGEALDDRGDVTLVPLASNDHELRQTDIVTSAGLPGDEFEPHHTVHGFRYVRVLRPSRRPRTR